ncbi:hypothetical protein WDW37_17690, partial [Bdellovibrionota bacterium FG-1]
MKKNTFVSGFVCGLLLSFLPGFLAPAHAEQNLLVKDSEPGGGSDDHCDTSGAIDGKYTCSGTKHWVDAAKVTNMVAQTAGSMTTQIMGQNAQTNAQAAGTQSAALKGAAETQETAGEIQMTAGTVNLLMGAIQLQKASEHTRLSKQLKNGANDKIGVGTDTGKGDGQTVGSGYLSGTKDTVSGQIIDQFTLNRNYSIIKNCTPSAADYTACMTDRADAIRRKSQAMQSDVSKIGKKAASEQAAMAAEAQAGGMVSIMTGLQQGINGGFNYAAAQKLKDAANKLGKIETKAGTAFALPGADPFAEASAPKNPVVIGGAAPIAKPELDAATEDPSQKDDGLANLGTPTATNEKPDGINDAPAAGKFVGKDAPGGGGGGGGFSGGGSTSAAGATPDEPTSRAVNDKGGLAYDGGGGVPRGGGGGGGGAGIGGGGPDLAAMMAQL